MLPCGVDLERFYPIPRAQARSELGLDPEKPYLLFPADPARAIKRYDLALALAREVDVELLVLGGVDPAQAPLWVNAVNAVLMPSGMRASGWPCSRRWPATCRCSPRPSASTPKLCAASPGRCARRLSSRPGATLSIPHLTAADPRIQGRAHAEPFSGPRMAERVAAAWRAALERA